MTGQPKDITRQAWIGTGIIVLIVLLAIPLGRTFRMWGVDAVASLAPTLRWSYLGGVALFVLLARYLAINLSQKSYPYYIPWHFIVAVAFALLTYLLPASTFLRGDGQLIINNLSIFHPASHRSPLTAFISGLVFNGGSPMGMEPHTVYRLLNSLAAFLMLMAAQRFATQFESFSAQVLAVLALVFTGVVPTLFGVVEHYPLAYATNLWVLVLALEAVQERKFPIVAILLLFVAIGLHVSAIVFIPALILTWPQIKPKTAWILCITFSVIGLVAALFGAPRQLIPPFGPASASDVYSLWSIKHILDLINLVFWASPVLIAILLPLNIRAPKASVSRADQYLLLATLGAIGFTLLFDPDLGMPRDVDLLALYSLPVTLYSLYRLRRIEEWLSLKLIPPVLVVGLLTIGATVAMQRSEKATVSRFIHLLNLDERRSSYGWEVLAMHHRANKNTEQETFAYEKAIRFMEHPRYLTRLAQLAMNEKDYDKAEKYADRAIAADSTFALAYGVRGQIFNIQKDSTEAEINFRRALELDPSVGTHYANLAAFLSEQGRLDEALAIVAEGTSKSPPDAHLYYIYGNILELSGKQTEAFTYYGLALRIHQSGPWGAMAAQAQERLLSSPPPELE